MTLWYFNPPTVEEAPLAWEVPLDRYRMKRGISIGEIAPLVFEAARFWSYTDENAILNAGLRFFRGGYIYIVDDATRTALINGNVGVTADNFTPVGPTDFGFGEGMFGDGPFGG
jgi:hypothetical protein